jgi:hypothetical protein
MSQQAAKADGGNIGVLYCAELPVCAQVTTLATLTRPLPRSSSSAKTYNDEWSQLRQRASRHDPGHRPRRIGALAPDGTEGRAGESI